MKQILPAYGQPKETLTAIMMFYRNIKVRVRSPDRDTDYFDFVAGDTLAPSIDKFKENGCKLTQERSRRYPAKTITDADYADDIALMANAPTQAKACYIVWNEPL